MSSVLSGNGHGQRKARKGPRRAEPLGPLVGRSVGVLLGVAVIGFVAAAPFAWLLMLFLGNVGVEEAGFWGCVPGGVLIGALVAAGNARRREQ